MSNLYQPSLSHFARYSNKPLCSVVAWSEIEHSNTLDTNVTCPFQLEPWQCCEAYMLNFAEPVMMGY